MKSLNFGAKFPKFVSIILSASLFMQAAVFLPIPAEAAVPVYDDFSEEPPFTGWDQADNKWNRESDNGNHFVKVNGKNNDDSDAVLRMATSTVGKKDIAISFDYRIPFKDNNPNGNPNGFETGDHVRLEWTIDGTNWTAEKKFKDGDETNEWTHYSITLPSIVENESDFQFRFRAKLDAGNDHFDLDNFSLTGNSIDLCPLDEGVQTETPCQSDDVCPNDPGIQLNESECTPPSPTTGAIEITKYACSAETSVSRAQNGVGGTVPATCELQGGAYFGYVHGIQTDANSPWPELTAPVTPAGSTNGTGVLTIPSLSADGRYLIVETNSNNEKLAHGDILGLYCEGDADTTGTNDNQELTFVTAGGKAKCVAYNKAATPPTPDNSTVTLCKKNPQDTGLPNWNLMLVGPKIETVSVAPDGANHLSSSLQAGNYVFVANGYYVYRPGNPTASTSDAAYSLRLPSDSVFGGPYTPWVRENDFPAPHTGWLGIQVNESFTDWGSIFNPSHEYVYATSSASYGPFSFRILDDNYADNSGTLSVDIYPGFAGLTGGDGCVTFSGVPLGDYRVSEIMKSGWLNVSGLDSVSVNEAAEAFTVVNRDGSEPPPPVTLQVKIYKYLDGVQATAQSAGGYSFPMHATWDWTDTTHHSSAGDYFLGAAGHGGSGPYQAFTSVMTAPATYTTFEKTSDLPDVMSEVLPLHGSCQPGKFRFKGYRVGDSLSEAEAAALQTDSPAFSGLSDDKYVIVENETCPQNGLLLIEKTGAYDSQTGDLTFTINWSVTGGPVQDAVISDNVSSDMTISHINGGGATTTPTNIEWSLGSKNDGDSGSVSFVAHFNAAPGASVIWASAFSGFSQGKRKDGSAVLSERSFPDKALGTAQANDTINFVALGFGGSLVLEFSHPFVNGAGADIQVYETSYGNPVFENYPEQALVYASQNGVDWGFIGTSTLDEDLDMEGKIDWARYLKFVDVSDKTSAKFPADADGFDIDGVKVFHPAAPVCKVSNTASFAAVSNTLSLSGQSSTDVSINSYACEPPPPPIVCTGGTHLEGGSCVPDPVPAQCIDGIDNDGDGLIDAADPACHTDQDEDNPGSYDGNLDDESNDPALPAACADGLDNDSDGLIDATDPGCENTSDNDETNSSGGSGGNGGGGGGGSITSTGGGGTGGNGTGGSGGSRRHGPIATLTGAGEVLGATTDDGYCGEPYLATYVKYGIHNDPEQVKKLQKFLNLFFETNNPVTGFYGPITLEMVNKFQVHENDAVLLPWERAGLPTYGPTGYVYKTTRRWINILWCPPSIAYTPVPPLP